MAPKGLTSDEVRRAQDLVTRVQGISSCRISLDDNGLVSDVHIVATVARSPERIARDVSALLKTQMDVDVDYRKIGVVLFGTVADDDENTENAEDTPDTDDAPPTLTPPPIGDDSTGNPEPVPTRPEPAHVHDEMAEFPLESPVVEFPIEEYPARFEFQSVNLFSGRHGVKVEVELRRQSLESFGSADDANTAVPPWSAVASATLAAVSEFLDESTRLCHVDVLKTVVGGRDAFVVAVDAIQGTGVRRLVGCSVVLENEPQSVVFATLDAVNRVIGKLKFKSTIEYRIR